MARLEALAAGAATCLVVRCVGMNPHALVAPSALTSILTYITRSARPQVRLLSKHTGHSEEEIAKDIARPKYFNPYEAGACCMRLQWRSDPAMQCI